MEQIQIKEIKKYPVIGCAVQRCPACKKPLSFTGSDYVCRRCHKTVRSLIEGRKVKW